MDLDNSWLTLKVNISALTTEKPLSHWITMQVDFAVWEEWKINSIPTFNFLTKQICLSRQPHVMNTLPKNTWMSSQTQQVQPLASLRKCKLQQCSLPACIIGTGSLLGVRGGSHSGTVCPGPQQADFPELTAWHRSAWHTLSSPGHRGFGDEHRFIWVWQTPLWFWSFICVLK